MALCEQSNLDDERIARATPFASKPPKLCVCYCSTFDKAVRVGGGGEWRTCATRVVVVVYYCRGRCGLGCPSRTSERGGEGDCVKEGGGREGERERERALGLLLCHSPRN